MVDPPSRDILPDALLRGEAYPHAVGSVELLETHISWVFLAGDYAYKVKKPVHLPFVDFSTLEARRQFCCEELRLNRRFAPDLYLEIVEIRRSAKGAQIGGSGDLLDYAVKMRRFPQESLASALLDRGELTQELVANLATYLAGFHDALEPAAPESDYGSPESTLHNALGNFEEIAPLLESAADRDALAELRDWTEREFLARYSDLRARKGNGSVRECHGDLHLRNIALLNGRLVPFDSLEFSPAFRWNDVMSEVAFLVMDLMDRGAARLGWIFLNGYLERSGDYAGVRVLRFYLVYRALVRAKVHLVRARQPDLEAAEAKRLHAAYREYVSLARRCALDAAPVFILMHGFSGSGKSHLAGALVPLLGAIRIRSDVERKRLHGLPSSARSESPVDGHLYSAGATDTTYMSLAHAACAVAEGGYPAIVDAAFLKRAQRARLAAAASGIEVPIVIVASEAPHSELCRRIAARTADPSEATVDVLDRQIATAEAILPAEQLPVLRCESDQPPEVIAVQVRDFTRSLPSGFANSQTERNLVDSDVGDEGKGDDEREVEHCERNERQDKQERADDEVKLIGRNPR